MEELNLVVSTLKRTFEKNAWHGPSVKESLQDVSADLAVKKLPQTHSIIELVGHMTAWRIFTTKKLQGDNAYTVDEAANFPVDKNWPDTLKELDKSQYELIGALQTFDSKKLTEKVPHASLNYTYYTLIHGLIHHDLYHTGQIVLLKKILS